jgi:hypothetical protein
MEKCLPCRCLAVDAFSGSAIPAFIRLVTIMSHVGVTYRRGFGFVDWIDCTLYIHISELQAIQRCRCSPRFTVHRCTRTRILSLH